VACGRFGIVYSVVLKVVRQYALFEDHTASTWSAVRQWLDSPGVVSASWFTQIVVNPVGQRVNRHEHSAWVTRRWRMALIAAGTPPAGRAERSGANAAKEVTFDPTDPDARDSFLNRLCEGAHPIRIALDLLIAPLEAARNKALLTAGAAQVGIMAAMAIGFPPPPHLIALRNSALGAAAAAEASILLLEVVKSLAPGTVRINEALGDIANYLAQIDQLWVLRGLADILMGTDQKPRSATAISYALMDIHNYRDWVCSKNGDSIEVFFDAWTPDAKNFLDLVFQRVRQLEDGTLRRRAHGLPGLRRHPLHPGHRGPARHAALGHHRLDGDRQHQRVQGHRPAAAPRAPGRARLPWSRRAARQRALGAEEHGGHESRRGCLRRLGDRRPPRPLAERAVGTDTQRPRRGVQHGVLPARRPGGGPAPRVRVDGGAGGDLRRIAPVGELGRREQSAGDPGRPPADRADARRADADGRAALVPARLGDA
jgi:hypothetical protein